ASAGGSRHVRRARGPDPRPGSSSPGAAPGGDRRSAAGRAAARAPPAAPTARRPHPGRERSRRRPRSYGSSAWTPLMVLTYNSEVVLRNQIAAQRTDRATGQPVVHFEVIGNDPT